MTLVTSHDLRESWLLLLLLVRLVASSPNPDLAIVDLALGLVNNGEQGKVLVDVTVRVG